MCKKCDIFQRNGYDLPSNLPEHIKVFLAGDILVFQTHAQGLLAFIEGKSMLTVVDPTTRPGLHDEVLYLESLSE